MASSVRGDLQRVKQKVASQKPCGVRGAGV
jgi:hypothetical protein